MSTKGVAKPGGGGGLPEKLGGGFPHASWNPYPISDQNLWLSPPYFRPNRYVHDWRIKRETVLSPNDEEVASSKKHPQFKIRVHKPYPISDQNGQNWYPISDQNG